MILFVKCHAVAQNTLKIVALLAHLSRRLIGVLIVYTGVRRPSVRQHFQTTSPLNKNISMSSFKSSRDIQKKEGGPDSCFG